MKNEMGGACGADREGRSNAHRLLVRNTRERDLLQDLCIDGRIIVIWFFKKWNRGHELD
jgi:hypothetical protein